MFLFEPLRLAVFESLLPNGSSQLGPPLCFIRIFKFQIQHICVRYYLHIDTRAREHTHTHIKFNYIINVISLNFLNLFAFHF
jgi:hypothetical protein